LAYFRNPPQLENWPGNAYSFREANKKIKAGWEVTVK